MLSLTKFPTLSRFRRESDTFMIDTFVLINVLINGKNLVLINGKKL